MNSFLSYFESGLPAVFAVISIIAVLVLVERQLKLRKEKKDNERLRNDNKFAQSRLNKIYQELDDVILNLKRDVTITREANLNIDNRKKTLDLIEKLNSISSNQSIRFTVVNEKSDKARYNYQRTRETEIRIDDIVLIKSIKGLEAKHLFMEIPKFISKLKGEPEDDYQNKFKKQLGLVKYETVENVKLKEFCVEHERHFIQISKDIICNKAYINKHPEKPEKMIVIKKPHEDKQLYIDLPRKSSPFHKSVLEFLSSRRKN